MNEKLPTRSIDDLDESPDPMDMCCYCGAQDEFVVNSCCDSCWEAKKGQGI